MKVKSVCGEPARSEQEVHVDETVGVLTAGSGRDSRTFPVAKRSLIIPWRSGRGFRQI
jgi:hypothetical protein